MNRARTCLNSPCFRKLTGSAPRTRSADVLRIYPRIRPKRCFCTMNGGSVSRRSPGCWALAPPRLAPAPAGEWRTCASRCTVFKGLVHDGSGTETAGSAHAGHRPGSETRETVAAAAQPDLADGPRRSSGFVDKSAGNRSPLRLSGIRPAPDLGRLRRPVLAGDRARLDAVSRRHAGPQAAKAVGLLCGCRGFSGRCNGHPPELLGKSFERNPACLALALGPRSSPSHNSLSATIDDELRRRSRPAPERGEHVPVL